VDWHAALSIVVEGIDEHRPRPLVIGGVGPVSAYCRSVVRHKRT
jgi:hypothetical protein